MAAPLLQEIFVEPAPIGDLCKAIDTGFFAFPRRVVPLIGLRIRVEKRAMIFRSQLSSPQRKRIEAACVAIWTSFRRSIEEWAWQCNIVYDQFHILQHANDAIDEGRAEVFATGKEARPDQREEVVADKPMEEPGQRVTRGIEPAVPIEPARLQGVSAQ